MDSNLTFVNPPDEGDFSEFEKSMLEGFLEGDIPPDLFNSSVLSAFQRNSSSCKDREFFQALVCYLDLYLVPVIAAVGLAGNVLSFVVFVCTYMRRLSSSIYLAALAVANTGFLVCILVSWGINTGVDIIRQEGWCQVFIYVTYVSSFLSVWYVVSFTTERYIAVHFPLKRQELCTTRRAKIVVVALALFAGVTYSFGAWTSGLEVSALDPFSRPICKPLSKYHTLVSILDNMDTAITLILPFIAILVMNIKIGCKVVQFYRERKSVAIERVTETSSVTGKMYHNIRKIKASSKTRAMYTRTQVRVTKMLLTVSTMFLVLNLPRHTARAYQFFKTVTDSGYQPTTTFLLWQKSFLYLYYLHFSVNLFLYSALGKNFRKALRWLGRRMRHHTMELMAKCTGHCSLGRDYISRRREIILNDYKYAMEADRRFV